MSILKMLGLEEKFDFTPFISQSEAHEILEVRLPEVDTSFRYGHSDAVLINSAVHPSDGFSPNPPYDFGLFSKKAFEYETWQNPSTSMECHIIYACHTPLNGKGWNPVKTITKQERMIHPEIKEMPLKGAKIKGNAFLGEPEVIPTYLEGAIHPLTGETMVPVEVGYIIRETKWHVSQESCQSAPCVRNEIVGETYCILDFVLEGLRSANMKVARMKDYDKPQRVFVIETDPAAA